MKHTVDFDIESNEELLALFDQNVKFIFIHRFNPNEVIEWWRTSIKTKSGEELTDIKVRDMECDIQIELSELKSIIDMNTRRLRIYQFDKPLPDTVVLERLPEKSKFDILKQNGMKHFFWIDFEHVSISSFDKNFIDDIREKFSHKIN